MPVTLKSRLDEVAEDLRPQVSRAVKESAQAIADRAKMLVPVDEGELKRAIHIERRGPAEYAVVAGDNEHDVFYGHLIEYGSAAHTVRPRKKALHFFTAEGEVFTRKPIQLPAQPPRPFLVPALELERAMVGERVERALRGETRGTPLGR